MDKPYHVSYYRELRNTAILLLGGRCVKCGFGDKRALQIDHKKGDGYIKRKASTMSSRTICMEIIKGKTEDYQLLCANCNWIKKVEMDEQPYAHLNTIE